MIPKIRKSLEAIVGAQYVATDAANRLLYSRDMMTGSVLEMKAGLKPYLPDLICYPKNREEIAAILKMANRTRVPVVPYGVGSGVSGGTIPLHGGIMLDLKRMDRIEKIMEEDGAFSVVAQPNIIGQHLEMALNERVFTMGHFPSSIFCATLGGYLACRSAGQLSSKYGKIEDMVEEIEVVLPSGKIVPFGGSVPGFPKIRPRDLFVGTEGCLGVITRAKLKIHPLPPVTRYRGVGFKRLELALQAMREIMQEGLKPSVIRLYDPMDTLLLKYGHQKEGGSSQRIKNFLLRHPTWIQTLAETLSRQVLLILAFEGDRTTAKVLEKEGLRISQKYGGRDLGEEPGLHWLQNRYSVSFKFMPVIDADAFVDTIEVATTWDKLIGLYEGMKKVLTRETLLLAHFSHAYPEGCSIYFTVLGKGRSSKENCKMYRKAWEDAMEACLKAGGTISHHHGIGLLKAKYLPRELGGAMKFYREIKKKLDPNNIMNPGKMGL